MSCDLSELLEQSKPPDPESVDLIEQAFLEGQIDGQKADLAYLWLKSEKGLFLRKLLPTVLPKAQRATPRMM
jgi:hypothetical protein